MIFLKTIMATAFKVVLFYSAQIHNSAENRKNVNSIVPNCCRTILTFFGIIYEGCELRSNQKPASREFFSNMSNSVVLETALV